MSLWQFVRMVLLPENIFSLAGVHFVFARGAMLVAMGMFWFMCQFELIGPWLAASGIIGSLFSVILSLGLLAVPFWEAWGLRLARDHRQFGFVLLWGLCVVLTFGGHLYLVSAKGGQDRARQLNAVSTAEAIVSQGEAAVSTSALETRLAGQEETVQRLTREHERVTAWRTPLAQAIASGGSEPALRAVQIEISARRVARGEEPIREDGRARGSSDCRGVCGETAEAIEHEIGLVTAELRAAEEARDATATQIQERLNAEAGGALRRAKEEAAEVAGVETTTRNMTAFMDTIGRLGTLVGFENPEQPAEVVQERAANASDIAFLLLVTVVNLISWTNNAGHGGGRAPAGGGPMPLHPAPMRALPSAPLPPLLPSGGAMTRPAPMMARSSSGVPPEALDVRARPMGNGAPAPRPEPDREQLSALGSIAALRAKTRAMKGE